MATKTIITLVCGLCGTDDSVRTHTLGLDRRTADVDACTPCWRDVEPKVRALIDDGRPRRRGKVGAT